jgi:hypothetical protein
MIVKRLFTSIAFWIVVGLVLFCTAGFYARRANQRRDAQAKQNQSSKPLGHPYPETPVDPSKEPEEKTIYRGEEHPVPGSTPRPSVPQVASTPPPRINVAPAQPQLASYAFYEAPTPTPSPSATPASRKKREPRRWLTRFHPIRCQLVNTVESSHMNVPVIGLVTENVVEVNDGERHLIIPAGARLNGFANASAVRDRIEVSGRWDLVYPQDGREVTFNGIACISDVDPTRRYFGPEDQSPGLRGERVDADPWSNLKGFAELLIGTVVQSAQTVAGAAVQGSHTAVGYQLPESTPFLIKYLDQMFNGSTGDASFVRVPSTTEFYVIPVDVIDPDERSIGAERQRQEEKPPVETEPETPHDAARSKAFELEKEVLKASQPQPEKNDDKAPRYSF